MQNNLINELKLLDSALKDEFLSNEERALLTVKRAKVIQKLQELKIPYPITNINDRERINQIQKEIKNLTEELDSYTKHKSGKSYSLMLKDLIYEYINYEHKYFGSVQQYKRYEQLRGSISKGMNIKTAMYTKSEYINALYIIESVWNFKIPDKYKI